MFKIHITFKHGLIVNPFRILVYQPGGALQKCLLVIIWAIVFVYCDVFIKTLPCSLKIHRPDIVDITAHLLCGTILQGNVTVKILAGA